jgi:hypothetical protein
VPDARVVRNLIEKKHGIDIVSIAKPNFRVLNQPDRTCRTTAQYTMPRIAVKNGDKLREHPREFSLLYELGGSKDGIDSEVRLLDQGLLEQICSRSYVILTS